jgi:hypothetical protein
MAYKASINPPELQPPGIDFDHPDAAECLRVRLSAEAESKTRLGLAFRASTRGMVLSSVGGTDSIYFWPI